MSKPRTKTRDYLVGYGKPPEHSRFVKGVSGNAKGRPKGKKNMDTIIHEALFEPIQIQQNGRQKTMPAIQAILLKMRINALAGDHRASMAALQLAGRTAAVDEVGQTEAVVGPLDEQTLYAVLRDYLDHKAPPAPERDDNPASEADGIDADGEGDDQ